MKDLLSYLYVLIISAVPLIEQRGAIPWGIIVKDLAPIPVFLVSLLGSLLPAPIILLMFNTIFKWMKKYKSLSKITDFIEKKLQKNTPKIEKYKEIGLIAFIGVPLPTTGVWTGSAVAAFLGLDFKKSLFCAFAGAVISAAILTAVSILAPAFLEQIGIHF
ncbi:MAG: COG2426 family protein [Bacillota bacterium]